MSDMSETPNPGILRWLPLALISVAVGIVAFVLKDYVNFEVLRDNRETLIALRDANLGLTIAIFMLTYAVLVAFSVPGGGTLSTLTGGFLFGTMFGTMINVSSATLGATAIFLAARYGFGERLSEKLQSSQGFVKKFKDGIDDNQWSMLFLIRLVPAVPFFVANLLPAILHVPLHRYVISTFLGIIPGGLVFTSVGAGLGEVFAAGETPDLGIVFAPHIMLPIVGLCILAALPIFVKVLTGKKDL